MKKKKLSNKKEIIWNLVNSFLAGGLVFIGALTTGKLSWESVGIAILVAIGVMMTKFADYWKKEESEYQNKNHIFTFIKF